MGEDLPLLPGQSIIVSGEPETVAALAGSKGLALIGAIVAEFVAGTGGRASGLAYRILEAGFQLQIPRMFAALACALWRESPPQLLVLDEPTNHLDLASLQAIEAALHGYPGALLVVSHDEAFLQGLGLTHRLQWRPQGWLAQVL